MQVNPACYMVQIRHAVTSVHLSDGRDSHETYSTATNNQNQTFSVSLSTG